MSYFGVMEQLSVLDLFCGAGGFSEGFRQQGFRILMGIDNWEPAIETFNLNYGLQCAVKNILDFESSIEEIENLPDTEIIIGSPPCVTFSSSNISGKADKASGITLTQIFLRIVAVKKWKAGSILKAWYMENVPSSIKHLGNEYSFEELGLGEWASANKIGRTKIAIKLEGNQQIINSADYGSAQSRERVISGEIIQRKKLIIPEPTHCADKNNSNGLRPWRTLKEIKSNLPKPNCKKCYREISDPNYPGLSIKSNQLTDHYYDTALFQCEWQQSKFLKTNHPYMGKMSFPENDKKPSRTITATKIGTSREALIYKSERKRVGDGEFRTPTVRESACLMGFPLNYQFHGSENTKWRLVGNAVCSSVANALAKQVRTELGMDLIDSAIINVSSNYKQVNNLNTYSEKIFQYPPRRTSGSRFRRHPFKDGNITVTLSNYDIEKNSSDVSRWITSVQYGNGDGFPIYRVPDGYYKTLEQLIKNHHKGVAFLEIINNGFSEKISDSKSLQEMYEMQFSQNDFLEPTALVEEIALIINNLNVDHEFYHQDQNFIFKDKQSVPLKQLYALYSINLITSLTNK
jgi:DNA (cytosine-5)-methyltransferase 1